MTWSGCSLDFQAFKERTKESDANRLVFQNIRGHSVCVYEMLNGGSAVILSTIKDPTAVTIKNVHHLAGRLVYILDVDPLEVAFLWVDEQSVRFVHFDKDERLKSISSRTAFMNPQTTWLAEEIGIALELVDIFKLRSLEFKRNRI